MHHAEEDLFIMVDDENKISILDPDEFEVIGGWSLTKKIACSCIGKYLYLAIDWFILVYNLEGEKVTVINTESQVRPQTIMEVGNFIYLINGTGTYYKYLIPKPLS